MKKVCIAGGSGLIGKSLRKFLIEKGYNVFVFTRNRNNSGITPSLTYSYWNPQKEIIEGSVLKDADAIINLAGENIAEKRWTTQRKQELTDSRIQTTRFLVDQIRQFAQNNPVFISTSATGIYGADAISQNPFNENSEPAHDFLSDLCKNWEAEAQKADSFSKTVILRFGIVLDKNGGAYKKFNDMLLKGVFPFILPENINMSWITINDLIRLIYFALDNSNISGIYNAVSPNSCTYRKLIQTMASAQGGVKIPAPVTPLLLELILGEMGREILKSCNVSAQKILSAGFDFEQPTIEKAVSYINQQTS